VAAELSLTIRAVHVAAAATLLGGAVLLAALPRARAMRDAAVAYEWMFWPLLGVLVLAGVGNLGAFGSGLPAPGSAWGGRLTAKLLLVVVLLALSAVRTLALVLGCGPRVLGALHTLTAALLAAVLALAEVLAHAP